MSFNKKHVEKLNKKSSSNQNRKESSKELFTYCSDEEIKSLKTAVAKGISNRHHQPHEQKVFLEPKRSPINVPLIICRNLQKAKTPIVSKISVLSRKKQEVNKDENCKCPTKDKKGTIHICVPSVTTDENASSCKCGTVRSQFKSTPTLKQTKKPLHSQFKSTSVLDRIDESQPYIPESKINTQKSKRDNKKKSKNHSTIFQPPSYSNGPRSQFASTSLLLNGSRKTGPLRAEFHSTPLLESQTVQCSCAKKTKSKSNALQKLLSSTSIVSRNDRFKSNFVHKNPKGASLLDRSCLNQKEYMDLLSIPNSYKASKTLPVGTHNKCERCKIEPCPPRLVQMSIPTKRYVLANWKSYQNVLPAEVLTRFDKILQSGNNELEPRDARHYFKQLNRKKAKEKKKKKRQCKHCCEDKVWLEQQVKETADAILEYFQKEPLHMLNFKEMMVSDEILNWLERRKLIKISMRSTKNVYKKTVIDICDKMVTWMDKLNYFVRLRPLDSKEEIAIMNTVSFESLEIEEEEVEEEEEERYEEAKEYEVAGEEEEEWIQFFKKDDYKDDDEDVKDFLQDIFDSAGGTKNTKPTSDDSSLDGATEI